VGCVGPGNFPGPKSEDRARDRIARRVGVSGRTLEKAARDRQLKGISLNDDEPSGNFPEGQKGDTRDRIARRVGVSGRTLEKAARDRQAEQARRNQPQKSEGGNLPPLEKDKTRDRVARRAVDTTTPSSHRLGADAVYLAGSPSQAIIALFPWDTSRIVSSERRSLWPDPAAYPYRSRVVGQQRDSTRHD
jgi:hypothetical protein